jgi:hypothetical protein
MAASPSPTWRHAELERWYRDRLRPKVSRAVRSGTIRPKRAAALDRMMTDLLTGGPNHPGARDR